MVDESTDLRPVSLLHVESFQATKGSDLSIMRAPERTGANAEQTNANASHALRRGRLQLASAAGTILGSYHRALSSSLDAFGGRAWVVGSVSLVFRGSESTV